MSIYPQKLYKLSFIYKQKQAYLKPNKSQKYTYFKAESNLKKLQCSAEQVQCSAAYFGIQIPIFLKYFIPIFSNLKYIQGINTVKQIFQLSLHAIYPLALFFKRASLCNWQHVDLPILVQFIKTTKILCSFNLLSFLYFTCSQ